MVRARRDLAHIDQPAPIRLLLAGYRLIRDEKDAHAAVFAPRGVNRIAEVIGEQVLRRDDDAEDDREARSHDANVGDGSCAVPFDDHDRHDPSLHRMGKRVVGLLGQVDELLPAEIDLERSRPYARFAHGMTEATGGRP